MAGSIHNQSFDAEAASVFTAPDEPRLVRINGGWFGDVYISIGKPVEDIFVPDYVTSEADYEEAKAVLAKLKDVQENAHATDELELQELAYVISDLQEEIEAWEEDLEVD